MDEALFPGAVGQLPESALFGAVLSAHGDVPAGPPRFLEGFDGFAAYARRHGADPTALANDLSRLWGFLAGRADVLASEQLTDAAARFVGNVVAVTHPAATWRATPALEVGTSTISIPVAELVRSMVEHPDRREPFLDLMTTWPLDDLDERERSALANDGSERDLEFAIPPVPFVRPPLPTPVFRDADGRAIPYGSRWSGPPPEEAYSRVTHAERFAPLGAAVDALVDYLQTWYVVAVERSVDDGGSGVVRMAPSTGAAVTLTTMPDCVRVDAGQLFRDVAPSCTCDACDETAESAADALGHDVLSIAAGGFREVYPLGRRRWLHTAIRQPDGTGGSSGGPPPDLDAVGLEAAAAVLADLPRGWWPAWTLRADLA